MVWWLERGGTHSLAESSPKASLDGAETLEKEGNAEEVDFVLVDVDVYAGFVDELVVHAEGAGEAEANFRRGALWMSARCSQLETLLE
jgi:hypothetical protein